MWRLEQGERANGHDRRAAAALGDDAGDDGRDHDLRTRRAHGRSAAGSDG
jgi:hypothetical protein